MPSIEVIFLHSESCPHCHEFDNNVWKKFERKVRNEGLNVTLSKVGFNENQKLFIENNVSAVPAIIFRINGKSFVYTNEKSVNEMIRKLKQTIDTSKTSKR